MVERRKREKYPAQRNRISVRNVKLPGVGSVAGLRDGADGQLNRREHIFKRRIVLTVEHSASKRPAIPVIVDDAKPTG